MKNKVSRSIFNIVKTAPSVTPYSWGFLEVLNPMVAELIKRFFPNNPLRLTTKLVELFFKINLSPFQFELATDFISKIVLQLGKNRQRIFYEKSFKVSNLFPNTFSKINPLRVLRNFSKDFFKKIVREFRPNLSTDFILKIRCGFGKIYKRIYFEKSFPISNFSGNRFYFKNLSPTLVKLDNTFIFENSLLSLITGLNGFVSKNLLFGLPTTTFYTL